MWDSTNAGVNRNFKKAKNILAPLKTEATILVANIIQTIKNNAFDQNYLHKKVV